LEGTDGCRAERSGTVGWFEFRLGPGIGSGWTTIWAGREGRQGVLCLAAVPLRCGHGVCGGVGRGGGRRVAGERRRGGTGWEGRGGEGRRGRCGERAGEGTARHGTGRMRCGAQGVGTLALHLIRSKCHQSGA